VQLRSLESRTQGGTAGRLVSIDEKSIDEIDDPVEKRVATKHRSHLMMLKSMPRVLLIHTGGTVQRRKSCES
jgi:L-asparaginase/Glu-tRNA(Gln) amidotransferase subunit D